ncbi:MAG: hypothetical protein HY036_09425 [Nitrospirae bacterium]|nr:hypothetical protein [Nitrospirota bacterium]MBI3352784.1 hypothetical protein [Nitrospirota bacterium]
MARKRKNRFSSQKSQKQKSSFLIKDPFSGDFLFVYPFKREFDDEDWIYTWIEIKAGAFQAKYKATLYIPDFRYFRKQLDLLHQGLSEKATYSAMEEWLEIEIVKKKDGCLEASCKAGDRPGALGTLNFDLEFHPSLIPKIIQSLDYTLKVFPEIDFRRTKPDG